MLQFCAIAPVQWLKKVEEVRPSEQRTHMALVQYLSYQSYFDYYKEKLRQGETVILDNGAYEGAMGTSDELLKWLYKLKPSVLVLPDVPNDPARTLKVSDSFLRGSIPYRDDSTELIYVVHTDGKLETSLDSYKAGLDLGTTWLGFSRLTQTYGQTSSLKWTKRQRFVTLLKDKGLWQPRKVHAFGMLSGAVSELRALQPEFNSIDSSAPVWRGLHGYSLDSRSWPNYGFEPMATHFDESNWPCAKLNLEEVYLNCR